MLKRACIAAITTLSVCTIEAPAQSVAPQDLNINEQHCVGAPPDCKSEVERLRKDNARAWKGSYQGQRNVAFCLSRGCDGLVVQNQVLGCAWRIVIVGAGDPELGPGDVSNLRYECGKLSSGEMAAARNQAQTIYRTIYKRELRPVEW